MGTEKSHGTSGINEALSEIAIVWTKATDQKLMVPKVLQVTSLQPVTKVN